MVKKKTRNSEEFSFEHSLDDLQNIVVKLEDGNITLADSLKNYELGIKRLKECYRALNEAEQKIRQLAELDDDGNLITKQLEEYPPSQSAEAKLGQLQTSKRRKKKRTEDELF